MYSYTESQGFISCIILPKISSRAIGRSCHQQQPVRLVRSRCDWLLPIAGRLSVSNSLALPLLELRHALVVGAKRPRTPQHRLLPTRLGLLTKSGSPGGAIDGGCGGVVVGPMWRGYETVVSDLCSSGLRILDDDRVHPENPPLLTVGFGRWSDKPCPRNHIYKGLVSRN
jgi:hypothetical protein